MASASGDVMAAILGNGPDRPGAGPGPGPDAGDVEDGQESEEETTHRQPLYFYVGKIKNTKIEFRDCEGFHNNTPD